MLFSSDFDHLFPWNEFQYILSNPHGYNVVLSYHHIAAFSPPWAFTTIITFFVARHSDKTDDRAFHIMILYMVATIGCFISLSTMNIAGRYGRAVRISIFHNFSSNISLGS